MITSLTRTADELKGHLRRTTEQFLKRNVDIDKIDIKELATLCRYFSISFTVAVFGGSDMTIRQRVNKHIKEGEIDKSFEEDLVPEDPQGIGGWRYADRLEKKVLKQLEIVVNQGSSGTGQQLVNAGKTLLAEAAKAKNSAMDLMEAYEKQLIILAEFTVENFLPAMGRRIRKDLRKEKDEILKEIKNAPIEKQSDLLENAIEKLVRSWNLKRFELLFAETMADDKEVSDAFNFTKDMITTFIDEKYVALEDESSLTIRKDQAKRKLNG